MLVFAAVLLATAATLRAESNWPGWRGPRGDGHSTETGIPVSWSPAEVTWKVPLEGFGQSTPTIWGERIFLTMALDEGHQRVVFCCDRNDGRILWSHVAWTGDPEPIHATNSHASASCATDGNVVIAFFGHGGLHAYSVEGQHLWSRDLGPFEGPWGTAASPVLYGDWVIQNCDSEGHACVMAFEKSTGNTVWTTEREVYRGWSTPFLYEENGRTVFALNGHTGVRGYDAQTGRELWYCQGFNGRGTPTATPGNGLLYMVNGLKGDFYAVRPGGSGNVTETHMAFHTPRRSGRDLPSPIVIGRHVLVMAMDGIVSCYDGMTGEEVSTKRLTGPTSGARHWSSPIAVDGKAYFQDDAGQTFVLEPGPQVELVSLNTLSTDQEGEELFRASLTPSEGQIFTRSNTLLYCIGERTK